MKEPIYDFEKARSFTRDMYQLAQKDGSGDFVDYLSNGQWVDEKKYGPQWRKLTEAKSRRDRDGKILVSELCDIGALVVSGNGSSVRMVSDAVIGWRTARSLKLSSDDQSCPRFFGGVLEDDIWPSAPLRTVSMITLSTNPESDPDMAREVASMYGGRIMDDGGVGNIVRIMCASSRPLITFMKGKGLTKTIRSTEVHRRELVDIPEDVLSDMIRFYLVFTKSIIKGKMSVILANIPREEIESQLYIWICDGIRRFDEKASVPFGAYLADRVKRWAFDLSRSHLDSPTAAQQSIAQKAQKIEGTLGDKAKALGVSVGKLEESLQTSRRIYSMGNGALRLDAESDDSTTLHERVAVAHTDSSESDLHRQIIIEALKCSDPDLSLTEVVKHFWDGEELGEHGAELITRMKMDEGNLRRFVGKC